MVIIGTTLKQLGHELELTFLAHNRMGLEKLGHLVNLLVGALDVLPPRELPEFLGKLERTETNEILIFKGLWGPHFVTT